MRLETMEPDPVWDADAHEDTVDALAALGEADDLTIRVWGGDWCGDCRSELPKLAAALDAAGLLDAVESYPVDRDKDGELTDEYGVEFIPTVVIERDGEEVARFVESEPVPAAVYLADQVSDRVPDLS